MNDRRSHFSPWSFLPRAILPFQQALHPLQTALRQKTINWIMRQRQRVKM